MNFKYFLCREAGRIFSTLIAIILIENQHHRYYLSLKRSAEKLIAVSNISTLQLVRRKKQFVIAKARIGKQKTYSPEAEKSLMVRTFAKRRMAILSDGLMVSSL